MWWKNGLRGRGMEPGGSRHSCAGFHVCHAGYCGLLPVSVPSGLHHFQRAVIVAMVAMRMVQAAIDQIVHMRAMRHSLMPAAGAVNMAVLVPFLLHRGAVIGVSGADLDHMLIHMIPVRVMQVPVMQIVHMIAMAHGGMSARRPMLVVMVFMVREFTV